jgi:hypothetical protein
MQNQDPQAPPTPAPAPAPAVNAAPASVYVPGPQGGQGLTIAIPRTARELDALRARRSEISSQLTNVDSRRQRLIRELKGTTDPTAIKGLQGRLELLDSRQLQLESDLATTGQVLTAATGQFATTSNPDIPFGLRTNQVMALSVLSIIFVLFPMAIGVARNFWKRGSRPGPAPAALAQTAERLERLESSVDAIAIEIERISEGQRFVTKLLSEGQPARLAAK